MLDRLNKDIIEAMKAKDSFKLSVLKMIKSEIQKNDKDKEPREHDKVVKSYHKKLTKSLSLLSGELKEKLEKELEIISKYLQS